MESVQTYQLYIAARLCITDITAGGQCSHVNDVLLETGKRPAGQTLTSAHQSTDTCNKDATRAAALSTHYNH